MKSLEECIDGLKEMPSAFRERKFELIIEALEALKSAFIYQNEYSKVVNIQLDSIEESLKSIEDRLTLLELNKADRSDAIN